MTLNQIEQWFFSDCLSALQAIKNFKFSCKCPVICEIIYTITSLSFENINVYFAWVPGHSGVPGNEWADQLAKQSLTLPRINCEIGLSVAESFSLVKCHFVSLWQNRWDASVTGRAFYRFQPSVVCTKFSSTTLSRKGEVVLFRLFSGHFPVNSYLHRINKHPDGNCDRCLVPDTIEHFLLKCSRYNVSRVILFNRLLCVGISRPNIDNILNPNKSCDKVFKAVAAYIINTHIIA